ncbi:MAG: calcium/sodium antiporter [Melioribacteraceae bacterium]|nr:calcium/sodium antiporter [Melioribacteraceae bacterium]
MSSVIHILIISATIIGLWGGALLVVESASRIAKRLGLSELVIGLTVVAIATSAPEFAVTVVAAIEGNMSISVGNVVGSNIFNLGVILGLVALFGNIVTTRTILLRDGLLLFFTGLLLILFFYDNYLTLIEGILLTVTLIIYIFVLIRQKQKVDDEIPAGEFKWLDIIKLIAGVALIITSADFLVDSASELARYFGVSEWMIGITIVATGTSVPELATSIVALAKGRHGISIGNLIGSDLFNMLGVLGIASIIRTLNISESDYISIILLVANLLLLLIFIRTGWKLTKYEGMILIFVALLRWWSVSYF